jgi:hypothetical protein
VAIDRVVFRFPESMGDFPPLFANQPGEKDAEESEGEPKREVKRGEDLDGEGDRDLDEPEAKEDDEEK